MVDRGKAAGIGGTIDLAVYMAHVNVPGLGMQYGRFQGIHLSTGGQPHRVLIGRSFLKRSLLIYDGISGVVKICR